MDMGWNFRVLRTDEKLGGKSYPVYQIIQVYYDEDGNIEGWSDSSKDVLIWGTYEDLKGTYEYVKHAFDKPVLMLNDEGDLVNLFHK